MKLNVLFGSAIAGVGGTIFLVLALSFGQIAFERNPGYENKLAGAIASLIMAGVSIKTGARVADFSD